MSSCVRDVRPAIARVGIEGGADERPANQPFSGWHNVFPDPGMTVAAIDRLVHHSTIFELNVESYRRRKASDKQNARRRQLPSDNSPAVDGHAV